MRPVTLVFPIVPTAMGRIVAQWDALAKKAAEKGINLRRDGTFSGTASGRVTFDRTEVVVLITDKPFLVPVSAIESELRKLFV